MQQLKLKSETDDRGYLELIAHCDSYKQATKEEKLSLLVLALWEATKSREFQRLPCAKTQILVQRHRRQIVKKFKVLDLRLNNLSAAGKLEFAKLSQKELGDKPPECDRELIGLILDSRTFNALNPHEQIQFSIIVLGFKLPSGRTPLIDVRFNLHKSLRHITHWSQELTFSGSLSLTELILDNINRATLKIHSA
jgi:hypothetical protein